MEPSKKTFIVAVSGASGTLYAVRLLKAMLSSPYTVYLIYSEAGKMVAAHETGYSGGSMKQFLEDRSTVFHDRAELIELDANDLFAAPASGSFAHQGMIVIPCSMKTLGAVASGISENLIQRAADVTIKEKRPLILVVRETPLSPIHLKNMHHAAVSGATIMPASPSFYHHPETIDELIDSVVSRAMDHLGISHEFPRWRDDRDALR